MSAVGDSFSRCRHQAPKNDATRHCTQFLRVAHDHPTRVLEMASDITEMYYPGSTFLVQYIEHRAVMTLTCRGPCCSQMVLSKSERLLWASPASQINQLRLSQLSSISHEAEVIISFHSSRSDCTSTTETSTWEERCCLPRVRGVTRHDSLNKDSNPTKASLFDVLG